MPGSSPQARYDTAAAPPQAEGEPSKDQETGDNIFCSDEQQPAPAAGAAGGRPLASDSRPWPEVRGNLTLRLDPREKGGISALCTIQDSVVTMRAYVIDTGSIGSRARHHVTGWGLPIYPPP